MIEFELISHPNVDIGLWQGRNDLLVEVLSKYSEFPLEDAVVVKTGPSELSCFYWIRVTPEHQRFWDDFEQRYDPGFQRAKERYAVIRGPQGMGPFCPEFRTLQDLFGWLYECTNDIGFIWVIL